MFPQESVVVLYTVLSIAALARDCSAGICHTCDHAAARTFIRFDLTLLKVYGRSSPHYFTKCQIFIVTPSKYGTFWTGPDGHLNMHPFPVCPPKFNFLSWSYKPNIFWNRLVYLCPSRCSFGFASTPPFIYLLWSYRLIKSKFGIFRAEPTFLDATVYVMDAKAKSCRNGSTYRAWGAEAPLSVIKPRPPPSFLCDSMCRCRQDHKRMNENDSSPWLNQQVVAAISLQAEV
jgi:hypothetical protein